MKKLITTALVCLMFCMACDDNGNEGPVVREDVSTFKEIGSVTLAGGAGASEITAYDPQTKKLFVVNNGEENAAAAIDVVDLANPASPMYEESINITVYGGGVNSVAVSNGLLAAAIEANEKTGNGKVVIFNTSDLSEEEVVTVGALPDMVTFSPDGAYILSANEGEPNDDYSIDPDGSVSIIDVANGFAVVTLDFAGFNSDAASLMQNGYRVFGPNADLAADTEPEYIAVSEDSRTAWVTLQENNGVAKINLQTQTIDEILPLGYKDYSIVANAIDPSDEDGAVTFAAWPVKGVYMPDAIASFRANGTSYFITANEGDAREYDAFEEETRIKDLELDATVFPNAENLQEDEQLGRLNVTATLGDTDDDGDYDALYSFGGRSFTIWNGSTGSLVYDSGNDLDKRTHDAGLYDDGRSDSKGSEPEAVTIGSVGNRTIAFVGLERADAVLLYDVSNPSSPTFIKLLETGDAPEGVLFVKAEDSPNGKSLLIVSSEEDGVIKIYSVD